MTDPIAESNHMGNHLGNRVSEPDADPAVDPAVGSDAAWEAVIGLEVHCELSTATKLFCGCVNAFGSDANTNVCPTCLGLPGSLPVVNEAAVEFAMRLGRALGCEVMPSEFARKNYFYPDMPKDYQISQYDRPTNTAGTLVLPDGTTIGITRAHIEEDTGKNTHVGGSGRIHDAGYSLIDYNRSGVPLVEIVSEPDIRTEEQARAYVEELRAILLALEVSDARMEEGSLRVDANVSVRRGPDAPFGTRTETKNLNSLRSLQKAIQYEMERQIDLLEHGDTVRQETRHWDEAAGRTRSGRSKEEAEDYRYFPEPDLVPLIPTAAQVEAIDRSMPMLPAERRSKLAQAAGVTTQEAALAVARGLDELAIAAIEAGAEPARLLTHIEHNLAGVGSGSLGPADLARLVQMEISGELTATQAKTVLTEMVASGRSPGDIAAELGFEAMADGELSSVLDEVIAANPTEWERFAAGDEKDRGKLTGFFVGQVMKITKGQADGKAVTAALNDRV